tara:strand:- start:2820 stop:4658 length:1839 start_codon:yes stop_codon:yes gene_type:complete
MTDNGHSNDDQSSKPSVDSAAFSRMREHLREISKKVLSSDYEDHQDDGQASLGAPDKPHLPSEGKSAVALPKTYYPSPAAPQSPYNYSHFLALASQPMPPQSVFLPLGNGPHIDSNIASSQPTRESGSSRRDKQVDHVIGLLKAQFRLTLNETKSVLLADRYTGQLLPIMDDVVVERVKWMYWHSTAPRRQDVSNGVIKSALSIFGNSVIPDLVSPFYGRAGYDLSVGKRYLDIGHQCVSFSPGLPTYQPVTCIPHIKPRDSLPMNLPEGIGNIHPQGVAILFDITALPGESDLLVIAWMVLAWRPDNSQVMLELLGEPNVTLEQAQQLLKRVLDPATNNLEGQVPKTLKQLDDYAQRQYLLSFTRVDALSETQQKGLYSLMQGKPVVWKSKGKRSDVEIKVQCPVMLNSAESVVTYAPLAGATLSIELVNDEKPLSRGTAVTDPTLAEATISYGLLHVFGYVNRCWSIVESDRRFERYGGLQDLCRIGELVAVCLGREPNDFWQQFNANQQSRREYELEESPIALAMKRCLEEEPEGVIEAAVKDWLVRLEAYRPAHDHTGDWPATARGLAAKFKQSRSLLEAFGICLHRLDQRGPYGRWRAALISKPVPS